MIGEREIKDVLEKEKGALGSENVKYFGTKFECYKVIYFGRREYITLSSRKYKTCLFIKSELLTNNQSNNIRIA
jgi:hypothetical protein